MFRLSSRKFLDGADTEVKVRLQVKSQKFTKFLRPLPQLLACCGCGSFESTPPLLSICWTIFILGTLTVSFGFQLFRLVFSSGWANFNVEKAMSILVVVWHFQVLCCAALAV